MSLGGFVRCNTLRTALLLVQKVNVSNLNKCYISTVLKGCILIEVTAYELGFNYSMDDKHISLPLISPLTCYLR